MQVDPGFLQLTPRLKLKHDKLLPNFASNCNLRHYILLSLRGQGVIEAAGVVLPEKDYVKIQGRAVPADPAFLQSTPSLPSGTFSS